MNRFERWFARSHGKPLASSSRARAYYTAAGSTRGDTAMKVALYARFLEPNRNHASAGLPDAGFSTQLIAWPASSRPRPLQSAAAKEQRSQVLVQRRK